MKRFWWSCLLAAVVGNADGQNEDWVEMMNDPSVNFYHVQQSFENYWKEREVEKGKGWKQFKRWEAFMEPRVYPEGIRPNPSVLAEAESFLQQQFQGESYGQWQPMGPYDGPSLGGVGRINAIAFHPSNADIIWAGAPAGGLWKSTDRGATWTTNTDQFVNLGISQIVINPHNPDIMYIATGDNDGGDTYSYGVLKSTDGGDTWSPTGLSMGVQQQIRISDLWIHPDNPDTLIATTRNGIYRTENAGSSWNRVTGGSYNRLTQKAGNPNVLFTSTIGSSVQMMRSTDNGLTWSVMTDPDLPVGRRVEIETTPDDSNYVYALYGANDNGFGGLYLSTDGGDSWQEQATSPNLLGWRTDGRDNGGQAWYDLELVVDPTDKNRVHVGGVNIWTSSNAGTTWSMASHWYGGGGNPYVHADVHELKYHPLTGNLYAATDGGIYRDMPNQHGWDALNNGMNITQYYGFDNSATDTSLIIAGSQDNGTHLMDGSVWLDIRGGDGMLCFIDTKNPNIMYSSVYYGQFRKSNDRGNTFFANFNLPPSGSGNWVTPFLVDPLHPDTLYAGFSDIWRSYNGGASFSKTSANSPAAGVNLDKMAIAPNHTNIIFAAQGNKLWRSDNRGDNLTTLNVPGSNAISYIGISPVDPDHVVVTKSGYSGSDKVYESFDGGQSWTNISAGLPNLPVNCVTIEDNAVESIYIGSDIGIFYRDFQQTAWAPFNTDLPNVIVNELKISYKNRKLRAATYGRGVWESPLYSDLVAPSASATFPSSVCVDDTFSLQSTSSYSPSDFEWQVSPSTGVSFVNGTSASSENPQLIIAQKGLYNVRLKVTNNIGEDSIIYTSALAVGGYPLPFAADFENTSEFDRWQSSDSLSSWERLSSNGNHYLRANIFHSDSSDRFEIISPPLDFADADTAWLNFDYAYSGKPGNTGDSLILYAAAGCSENWQEVMVMGENGTQNFVTANTSAGRFTPNATDWCGNGLASCPETDLSAWTGQSGVRFRLVAISSEGNDIYLDNFNVGAVSNAAPVAAFSAPNSTCALDTISLTDQSTGIPASWEWSLTGPDTLIFTDRNPDIVFVKGGTYAVALKVTNGMGSDSLVKTGHISVASADSVDISLVTPQFFVCTTDTLVLDAISINEGANPIYTWYRNGTEVGRTATSQFSYTGLSHGDELYAMLQSDMSCAFPDRAWSDTLSAQVYSPLNVNLNTPYFSCITDTAFPIAVSPAGGIFTGSNGIINGWFDPATAGPGTHEINYTVTDTNGCTYTATSSITVRQPLPLNVQATPTYCEGDPAIKLSLVTPLGGNYSGPGVHNNHFYPDSVNPGTYNLTYSYPLPVCGVATANVDVTVASVPAQPGVVWHAGGLYCPDSAVAYRWYNTTGPVPNANGQSYFPSSTDSLRVRVTNAAGCHSFSEWYAWTISLEEHHTGAQVQLYPNPAEDMVKLQITEAPAGNARLRIVNSLGATVMASELKLQSGSNEHQLDISALPAGVYILQLSGDKVAVKKPLVVN